MSRITLKSIPTIRLIENEYLADILFYFSKERGQSIVDNVTNLFNVSYHNFLETHPDFNGKIVIIGYSLGGIITYDILSHQRQPETPEEESEYRKIDVKYSKLDFKPDYFFGFGSPLAAMLTIRNQTPQLYHPDHDIVFENVFHPFDPLAYRFEPLLNDYYTEQPAVLVKRSIPLGPSFSFPSLPSIPGAGIFSFFSWKASTSQQQQQHIPSTVNDISSTEEDINTMETASAMPAKMAEDIQHEQNHQTAESIVANARNQLDNEQQQQQQQQQLKRGRSEDNNKKFRSPINAFFQYFSSPSASTKSENKKKKQPQDEHVEEGQENDEGQKQRSNAGKERVPGIITWDPLQEDIKDQVLGLRDSHSEPRLVKDAQQKQKRQLKPPVMRSRSQSFGSNQDFLKVNDRNSTLYRSTTGTTTATKKSKRINEDDKVKKQRHLVEVLGIDGVRMESFERARINFSFDSNENSNNKDEQINKRNNKKQKQQQQPQTIDNQNEQEQTNKTTDDNMVYTTAPPKKERDNKSSNDLWSDLNQELSEPGPAVTEPGQSKEQVVMDATQPKGNNNDGSDNHSSNTPNNVGENVGKEEEKKKEGGEEAEDVKQQAKLPRGRRIDHVLQPESFMSMIANEYLVGLRAHFSYWTNKDLLWHIVCRLENLDEKTSIPNQPKTTTTSTPTSTSSLSSSSTSSLTDNNYSNTNNSSTTNNTINNDDVNTSTIKER
ncbi:hypothetical protein BDC45DRAFT_127984 [Circinella umbellata]|nr:hypothetical protein BDC45DRAFT_127984 [Circinella umbellata]